MPSTERYISARGTILGVQTTFEDHRLVDAVAVVVTHDHTRHHSSCFDDLVFRSIKDVVWNGDAPCGSRGSVRHDGVGLWNVCDIARLSEK